MGKCNCDTPRVQKNRYDPCIHHTEASVQYYNKDQILGMIQAIMADRNKLTDEVSDILLQNMNSLTEILNEVKESEKAIEDWIKGFISSQYGNEVTEILVYVQGLAAGTELYDPNKIQGYIDTLENIEEEWAASLIRTLENYLPHEDVTMITPYDSGISSVVYRWGFSNDCINTPEFWYDDENVANRERVNNKGKWLWTSQTITLKGEPETVLLTYTKEYIPAEENPLVVTKTYIATTELDPSIWGTEFSTIEAALENVFSDDEYKYLYCHTTVEEQDNPGIVIEESYDLLFPIMRNDDGDIINTYISYNTWEEVNPGEWQQDGTPEVEITRTALDTIIEYYQNLLNSEEDYATIERITGYISLIRSLESGAVDWVSAVVNWPLSFENSSNTGLIDDLNEAVSHEEDPLRANMLDFINWYLLVKGYVALTDSTSSDVAEQEGQITFNSDDWLTKDEFQQGVDLVLQTIKETDEKKDCSCKAPIDILREEINSLKTVIKDLAGRIAAPVGTSSGVSSIPPFVAVPYMHIAFQPTLGQIIEDFGPDRSVGWFPITALRFTSQNDALLEKQNWETAYTQDQHGISLTVTEPQQIDGFWYIWLKKYTYPGVGTSVEYEFPFIGNTDCFSINPTTPGAKHVPIGGTSTNVGFKGDKEIILTEDNLPEHTHGSYEPSTGKSGMVSTIDNGSHSHDVIWGNYHEQGSGYYGALSVSSKFPTKTDNDAPYREKWYGQGTGNGFVQKSGLHNHKLYIPTAGKSEAVKLDPLAYYAPYLIFLPVPSDVTISNTYGTPSEN